MLELLLETPRLGIRMLLIVVGSFFIYQIASPGSWLPDYDSYQYIYEHNADMLIANGKDVLFAHLVEISNWIGLSYQGFRDIYVGLSICIFIWSFVRLKTSNQSDSFNNLYVKLTQITLFAAAFVFLIEYFQIRIRAGLSISLVLAVYSILSYRLFGKTKDYFICACLLVASSLNHLTTTVVMATFIVVPTVISNVSIKLSLVNKETIFSYIKLKILCVTLVSVGVYGFFISGIEARGVWVYSSLNPVRSLAMIFVPVSMSLWIISIRKNEIFNSLLGRNAREEIKGLSIVMVYTVCLICGVLTILLGLDKHAGEGMVRFFTLSSVTAVVALYEFRGVFNGFWLLILACNSLFFANTLLG